MGTPEVRGFLSSLASVRHVSASTQNRALSALLFLYRQVLARELAGGPRQATYQGAGDPGPGGGLGHPSAPHADLHACPEPQSPRRQEPTGRTTLIVTTPITSPPSKGEWEDCPPRPEPRGNQAEPHGSPVHARHDICSRCAHYRTTLRGELPIIIGCGILGVRRQRHQRRQCGSATPPNVSCRCRASTLRNGATE